METTLNLILMQHGYPIVNIPGDTESRLAYYHASERCNLDGDKEEFHRLITSHVLASARHWLKIADAAQ